MAILRCRAFVAAFLTAGLGGAILVSAAAADTKYSACSRLTAAELGAALKPPVSKVQDGDTVVDSGPYKGATVSSCTWRSGLNLVLLRIWPAPTTPEQRSVGMKDLQQDETLRQAGYTVVPANLPGAECYTLKPPANLGTSRSNAACTEVTKGIAFWLSVKGPLSVQQVKTLADKVAARLP
jgi:hypothetical protein